MRRVVMPVLRPHDRDRTILHRAVRVAIVLPPLLGLGLHVLSDPQFALVAAFGSFAALAMADFTGPVRSRLLAYAVLAVGGALMVALGTALSATLWPAVLAMLAIGVIAQFVMALGGQFALGNNAGVLAFVVAVMVPAGTDAIAPRVAGWLTAMAAAAAVATLLWPRHERRDLYQRIAEACRALAAVARAVGREEGAAAPLAAALAALGRVRDVQRALGFRAIGPPAQQRALLGLVDALGEAWRFADAVSRQPRSAGSDRPLELSVATTQEAIAAVMDACVGGRGSDPGPAVAALARARRDHRVLLDEAASRALSGSAASAAVVEVFVHAFPIRAWSFVTLEMGVGALVVSGAHRAIADGLDGTTTDDFAVIASTAPTSPWTRAREVLQPHLSPGSVWFHNSVRAGLALALSVLIARVTDVAHAFWVVLATLSVLRSNVVTTGATVISAVVGTLAGFVVATVAIMVLGPHPLLLWLTLPAAVFLAAYAPSALSFGWGQAMFALLVVELFNLMVPDGWQVGVARVEAVTLGAAVALVVSLIMWPRGASVALRRELAEYLRAAQALVDCTWRALAGAAVAPSRVAAARERTLAARQRAEEALAAFLGERGAKRLALDVWGQIVRLPVIMLGAADAAIALQRSGLGSIAGGESARRFDEALDAVCASYAEMADRLLAAKQAPGVALDPTIRDLDMVGGAGRHRAEMFIAAQTYVETQPDPRDALAHTMTFVFSVGWLGYLAHLRVAAQPSLEAIAGKADTPWWK